MQRALVESSDSIDEARDVEELFLIAEKFGGEAMAPRKKTRARREPLARPAPRSMPLRTMTAEALDSYFATLNGHKPGQLYDLVIREVEEPLFKAVLDYAEGNQSRAADILGINRGTLRKKLKTYGLTN
jgi:Fis family transcriptional regulator